MSQCRLFGVLPHATALRVVTLFSHNSWEAGIMQGAVHPVWWSEYQKVILQGTSRGAGIPLWFFQLSCVGDHSVFCVRFNPNRGVWFRLFHKHSFLPALFSQSINHFNELQAIRAAAVKHAQWAVIPQCDQSQLSACVRGRVFLPVSPSRPQHQKPCTCQRF